MMNELIIFTIGVSSGSLATTGFYLWMDSKRKRKAALAQAKVDKEKQELDKAMKTLEATISQVVQGLVKESVDDRLRKAADITAKQVTLDQRNQEQLLAYNELELEKLHILQSIIKDGQNPLISVRTNNKNQQMPLSAYIASIQKNLH